jgi:predicted nucleic acid-binding protein
MYVLDTCILIDYLRGITQAQSCFTLLNDKSISIITWMEVLVGAKNEVESIFLRQFLQQFHLINLDKTVSEQAVTLRQQHRMRLPDAIIWATAKVNHGKLVTRNTKDFASHHADVYIPYTL